MVVGPVRSANSDLHIGATEGTYKRVIRDRGGFVEGTTYESRKDLSDTYFGMHEINPKMSGDAVVLPTRDYVNTPPCSLCGCVH